MNFMLLQQESECHPSVIVPRFLKLKVIKLEKEEEVRAKNCKKNCKLNGKKFPIFFSKIRLVVGIQKKANFGHFSIFGD